MRGLALALILGLSSLAHAALHNCESAMIALQIGIDAGVRTEDYFDDTKRADQPTVHVTGQQPGPHGGTILSLKKHLNVWVSTYQSAKYDPQGDPRWMIEILGKEAAAYFGFRMTGVDTMEVPDATEFSGALSKVNEELIRQGHAPIPVRFYETPDVTKTKIKDYIAKFMNEGALPIAAAGNHLLHDISFHTGAIFLDPELYELKRANEKFLAAFITHLESKYANDPAKLEAFAYYTYLMRMREVKDIDAGTGVATAAIVSYLRDPNDDHIKMLHSPAMFMTSMGRNGFFMTQDLIDALTPDSMNYLASYKNFGKHDKLKAFAKVLPVKELIAALDRFGKWNLPSPTIFKIYEDLNSNRDQRLDDYCRRVSARRQQIIEAATELRLAEPF